MNRVAFWVMTFLVWMNMAMAQGSDHRLDHTKWKLIEVRQSQLKVPPHISFTLAFEGNSYVFSGCNVLSGQFQSEKQKLVNAGPARSRGWRVWAGLRQWMRNFLVCSARRISHS